MTITLTKEELLSVTGGRSAKEVEGRPIVFTGVEYDSRLVRGGELFVALKGKGSHGHHFVSEASKRGGSLFLVEESFLEDQALLQQVEAERLIVVKDSLEAFRALASWWREHLGLPVLAITGSVGKTTAKEMAASILLQTGPGSYSLKSYNNHVGVPYTLCQISKEHQWAVVEVGMNHAGEIRNLISIVKPNVAAITRIADVHIGNLGSRDNIAKAKLEIVEGLREGGTLILNGDDEVLERNFAALPPRTDITVLRFGAKNGILRFSDARSRLLDGISFRLGWEGEEGFEVDMPVLGVHNAMNAACSALASKALVPTLTNEQIERGLRRFIAPLARLNVKHLAEDFTLIDDSYNASPVGVEAMLAVGKSLSDAGESIGLILGEMREQGEFSEGAHTHIGKIVAGLKPTFLITVTGDASIISRVAREHGIEAQHYETPEEAADDALKRTSRYLLVKGSLSVGLGRAVERIVAHYSQR